MPIFKPRSFLYQNIDLFPNHAFLHHEIADRIHSYLSDVFIHNPEQQFLIEGDCDHYLQNRLKEAYPQLKNCQSKRRHDADLLISNLVLQNASNIEETITAYQENLAPKGRLILTTIAHGSFESCFLPNGPMLNPLPDIRALGDYLHSLGFVDTVMHIEKITLTYETIETLLMDLRILGRPHFQPICKGLRTPNWFSKWKAHMDQQKSGEYYEISLNILYGQASMPPMLSVGLDENKEAKFSIKNLKQR